MLNMKDSVQSEPLDILLRDITVKQEGGEEPAQEPLPENLDGYPENRIPPPIELYNRCIYAARALTS